VFTEDQAIFRVHQLELIYSQFGILENIFPDAPRSKINLSKPKPSPHVDEIVRLIDNNMNNMLSQLQQLSLQTASSIQASSSMPMTSQP